MSARFTFRDFALATGLLLIVAFFAHADLRFLDPDNLSNLLTDFSIMATLAVGMLLVILPGHIDLSAGSGLGLAGGIAAVLTTQFAWPSGAAMLIAVATAVIVWFAMGSLIVRERIPAFIVTLGGLLIFRGLFWHTTGMRTVEISIGGQDNLYKLLNAYRLPGTAGLVLVSIAVLALTWLRLRADTQRQQRELPVDDSELRFLKLFIAGQLLFLFVLVANLANGIPLPALIFAAVAVTIHVLTRHTPFGRHLYAIGGNEEAAVISGIPVKRVIITAFMILGAIVGLTGLVLTSNTGSSNTKAGELWELDAIAACVIGGVSLRGGRGNVLGVIFGALIIAVLINGMNLLAVSTANQYLARGAVLIVAVWMDVRMKRA
jgi:D-xylose transport system permease protein